jgi:cell wall assembly regulator SMI1
MFKNEVMRGMDLGYQIYRLTVHLLALGNHINDNEMDRTRRRRMRNTYTITAGIPEGKTSLGRHGQRWIRQNENRKIWRGLICLRIVTIAGFCEHRNEPSSCIKDSNILCRI